jgi:hypothetical protein
MLEQRLVQFGNYTDEQIDRILALLTHVREDSRRDPQNGLTARPVRVCRSADSGPCPSSRVDATARYAC